ncbi:ABC transporter ATP-binding protein [Ornithinibacillus bavariensis]|uniref:ABC transporter ATP-binding protein n=1 Tax=Ornithinibacillus bavariensis TaxID=545502 RepID=A0A920C7K9_9BACI|nr:ABC transporter ATP-binding protein [Ornithinibacillus bavariensis]GIO27778.1 ABC transporter ATP-binding protein [Ornithinibacillus bavariensis]
MLKVDSLSKRYAKNQVLHQLSFQIHPGEIIGLVGENGAGKSTLLRLLATIDSPDKGTISLDSLTYGKDKKEIRKHIGFVPQDIAIWDELSVRENMHFFEKLSYQSKSEVQLKQLCLDMNLNKWDEPVKTLSGGMKRKLNLAITLIHDPKVLLLDEPTVGIDLKSKKEIGTYLWKQAKEFNRIIVYTSHDMDEIRELCDRILCIGNDRFYEELLRKSGKEIISV